MTLHDAQSLGAMLLVSDAAIFPEHLSHFLPSKLLVEDECLEQDLVVAVEDETSSILSLSMASETLV